MSKYIPTIGIETHVQLKTKTKLFAGVGNDARNAKPNTLISHICVGLPGALPVLNEKAVQLAVRTAYILNTKPQKFSKFDRKHYFYPDLPKGYQISQYDQPLILGGHVDVQINGDKKQINITRVHLEEDAGKNTHPAGADYSLVDLNRAGTPLLEIVSEPEIHSAQEAKAYVRELYLLMKYADISDCDLFHGNMRFDVNVSLSSEPGKLGTRSEVKNLNSFRSVENAVNFEIKRQTELLEKGEKIVQETRGWDDAKQATTAQRGKEEAQDYRYMPEPDVPPIILDDAYLENIQKDLPLSPSAVREKLSKFGLALNVVEDIVSMPSAALKIIDIIEHASPEIGRRVALWFVWAAKKIDQDSEIDIDKEIPTDYYLELATMTGSGQLNSNAAQNIFWEMLKTGESPAAVAQKLDLIQVSDEGEIEKIVAEVISANPKATADVKTGEMKAIGFLVGQVMAKSQGKANPGLAAKTIKKQLGV